MTSESMHATMRDIVADRLARPPAEVMPGSRLIDDLGADSLDFVDLVFAIEKALRRQAPRRRAGLPLQLDFSSPEVMRDGFLTREVIERLVPALPALSAVPDLERVTPAAVFSLVTVGTLCEMVERKLAAPP